MPDDASTDRELTTLNPASAAAVLLPDALAGALALLVRAGKGTRQRLVPYGEMVDALAVVEAWLGAAGLTDGPVFRAFWKGGQRVRPGRLSVRAVADILKAYPVMVGGQLRTVRPHNLRRTYARLLRDVGVSLDAIQQNLGHADLKTTQGYIGVLDAADRQPPRILDFRLNGLPRRPAGDI